MIKRMKAALVGAVAAACVAMGLVACAPLLSALPVVTKLVTDAALVLDTIGNYVDGLEGVSDGTKADVGIALQRARQALSAAKEAAKGAQDLSDVKLDAALAAFRAAYEHVLALTKPLGVTASGLGLFGAPPGGQALVVPEYEHMRRMAIAEAQSD